MNIANVTPTLLTGINLVAIGIGCCIVGDYAACITRNDVTYRDLAGGKLVKRLAIVTQKNPFSNLVNRFVQLAVDAIAS